LRQTTSFVAAVFVKVNRAFAMTTSKIGLAAIVGILAGCATPPPLPSTQHLEPAPPVTGQPPEFAIAPALPKPPKPSEKVELYSVVVHEMGVQDLLFALARDAKVNVSIHPGISGTVTMSVLDQTLPEILDVISSQVDMRYEFSGKKLQITPDTPFLKMYRVSYPNIARKSESTVSTSTNIASTGSGGGGGSNASSSTITNTTNNLFWETLVDNLRDLLRETDKVISENQQAVTTSAPPTVTTVTPVQSLPNNSTTTNAATSGSTDNNTTLNGSRISSPSTATAAPQSFVVAQQDAPAAPSVTYREAASVIANPENGIINVRATQRQHEKVREFLDGIMENARRQVLIEATIVEVDLSDRFQQGIDWSLLRTTGSAAGSGIVITPAGPANGLLTGGFLSGLGTGIYTKTNSNGSITAAIQLLESFGTLRVLSSPKLSVLNSQTSVLKVVDNEVYFTIDVTAGTAATLTSPAVAPTYTSTINTVPIGFLMTVTPQINSDSDVILNLRPTISRITSYATDPSPALRLAGVTNLIPIVQSREMESILRVQSGDIAVLGGLIQDSRDGKVDSVPGLNRVPILGDLFSYKDNKSRKTELVIFIRPTVLTDASLEGNFQSYRSMLPDVQKAFKPTAESGQAPSARP
jgi:MSHA biogenesis protein MshL